jgi:hypothetical protein
MAVLSSNDVGEAADILWGGFPDERRAVGSASDPELVLETNEAVHRITAEDVPSP